MSRVASRSSGPTAAANGSSNDVCPICKSTPYLNPNMRFMVAAGECYHRMCSACVDRIFSKGPANCPVGSCKRTLRKPKFRYQQFDSTDMEREVDIRRRMAGIFNRREEEFETLRAYNDYLQEAEDLTFNLLNKVDVAATEKKIAAYEAANQEAIRQNNSLASGEVETMRRRKEAEREQARLRREAALREEEEEKRIRLEGRRDVIDALANGKDPDEIQREVRARERAFKRSQAERLRKVNEPDFDSAPMLIRGLKTKKEEEELPPFDPFGGLTIQPQYYQLQEKYAWDQIDSQAPRPHIVAGGYNVYESFYTRAICDAFAGLGVFVDEEVEGREVLPAATSEVATAGAADAAVRKHPKAKMEDDDVFG